MNKITRFTLMIVLALSFLTASKAQGPVEIQHAFNSSSGNSTTLIAPIAGNLGVAIVNEFNGYTFTPCAGWTQVGTQTNGGATYFTHVFVKGESPTCVWNSQGGALSAVEYEFAKYDPTNTVNVLKQAGSSNSGTSISTPGTPTVVGTFALTTFAPDVQTTVSAVSNGWTLDGCTLQPYQTLCSSSRTSLTTDTTTPITNTFTYSPSVNSVNTSVLLIAPGTAGTIPLTPPVISPAAGNYTSGQSITLTSSQTGVNFYYTLDGTTPTCNSTAYTSAFSLTSSAILQTVACDGTGLVSLSSEGLYTIGGLPFQGLVIEKQHVFSASGGNTTTLYNPMAGNLGIAAVNYYSGYSFTPCTGWTQISTQTDSGTTYFQHIFAAGESPTCTWTSGGAVGVVEYEFSGYNSANPVNLVVQGNSSATGTAVSVPGTPTVYGAGVISTFVPNVSANITAVSSGWAMDGCDMLQYQTICASSKNTATTDISTPVTNTFTSNQPVGGVRTSLLFIAPGTAGVAPLPTPVPSLQSGTFTSTQTVSLAPITGAVIHYTLDGSAPTCTSSVYTTPFIMDGTYNLQAIACNNTGSTSVVLSTNYLIGAGTLKGMSLGTLANLNGFVPFASASNPDQWQTNIASAAVDTNSATTIAGLKANGMTGINADLTMTYNVVDSRNPSTPLTYVYSLSDPSFLHQSDVTYAPVGTFTPIEDNPTPICVINNQGSIGGFDNHVLTLDRATGFIFEMWHAVTGCVGIRQVEDGQQAKPVDPTQTAYMAATNIAVFDLLQPSGPQRPNNYTSGDAAGLSIFQGVGRKEEFMAGDVKHALRFTFPNAGAFSYDGSSYGYSAYPAKHSAPNNATQPPDANNLIYDGMRLRLKAGYTNSLCTSVVSQRMITQLSNYGLMLADLGTAGQVQFTPDVWNSADIACFNSIPIDSFDMVQRQTIHYGALSNYPLDPSSIASDIDSNLTVPTPMIGKPVPVLNSAIASPTSIASGACSTLSTSFTGGTYAYWDKAGPVRSGETKTVCPTVTTTYRLTVQGESLIYDDGFGDGADTATAANGRAFKDVTIAVSSLPTPVSIAITPSAITAQVGQNINLSCITTLTDGTTRACISPTYTSTNTNLDSIASGVLTSVGTGTGGITASAEGLTSNSINFVFNLVNLLLKQGRANWQGAIAR